MTLLPATGISLYLLATDVNRFFLRLFTSTTEHVCLKKNWQYFLDIYTLDGLIKLFWWNFTHSSSHQPLFFFSIRCESKQLQRGNSPTPCHCEGDLSWERRIYVRLLYIIFIQEIASIYKELGLHEWCQVLLSIREENRNAIYDGALSINKSKEQRF